jgi:hypothetical protein
MAILRRVHKISIRSACCNIMNVNLPITKLHTFLIEKE